MSVTIIFGGQYGSEGKGKVAHFFAKKINAKYCVRVGGPNSGHTVYSNDQKFIFRQLPTGSILNNTISVLPAGSYIDISILKKEIDVSGLNSDRLIIDENAIVMNDDYREKELNLIKNIGSTGSGTGEAVLARIRRDGKVLLARDCKELKKYINDTKNVLRQACRKKEKIIAEGTQGFGLSLLHANEYPYTTSRDTSAASILSEIGLSPFDVKNIVMVIRTFPIRVSGNSGPLKNEISWNLLQNELGREEDMKEYTSCTNRIRRVARFDEELVKRSITCNNPNIIVMNHLDYCKNSNYIQEVEDKIGHKINYFGDSPKNLFEV